MSHGDPLRRKGAANIAAGALSRTTPDGDARWELGVVVSYNSATHTSIVKTHGGRPLRDVPQIKPAGGAFEHFSTGTSVVISWDLGIPVIVGCMDFTGLPQTAIQPPTILGVVGYGDDDPTQDTQGGNNYKPPTAPTDMTSGDWAHVGYHGNHVAVLGGGVTAMGSPTAHVRSFGISGTLQNIARRIETISDFGNWRAENAQGKTSFIMRAGSNQATETGSDEGNWTISLDLGATGDILDFKISEPKGKQLFRLHAGSDGRVQIYGDGGVDISSGAGGTTETRHDIAGDKNSSVGGDDNTTIVGSHTHQVGGSQTTQVGSDLQCVIGGSSTTAISGDAATSCSGSCTMVITDDANVTVGGGLVASVTSGVSLETTGPSADITATATGNATLQAAGTAKLQGQKVILGTVGLHPAPMFDVFLSALSGCISSITTAITSCLPDPTAAQALAAALVEIQEFTILAAQGIPFESQIVSND